MSHRSQTPFGSIESAHEYIALLAEAVDAAITEVEADLAPGSANSAAGRRAQALQVVQLNLNKLRGHMSSSRRILNDLRTLRRLLLEERSLMHESGRAAD